MESLLGGTWPPDAAARATLGRRLVRVLVATNLLLGLYYLTWRYLYSINWPAWPIAIPLVIAETYSFIDALFFGLTIWRIRPRGEPPPAPPGATVDVFITCYNEPPELVRKTVQAAVAISYPHRTYVLDDGKSPAMQAMAESEGAGYIVRSVDWRGHERHAKAGNLNNALFQTQGEFILILDADQIPAPAILDRTLGYFRDPKVAFVQTPQWFYNVPRKDPFGSDAPLFYGPIQAGKDGWNAAFFCGSNAVLRRDALMQQGIVNYVRELEQRVSRALRTSDRVLSSAERQLQPSERSRQAILELRAAVHAARLRLRARAPIQEVTWEFQRQVEAVSRLLVSEDLEQIRKELAEIPGVDGADLASMADALDDQETLRALAGRESSPLAAIGTVRNLLLAVDTDRADEAQPVMPMATISVTEDMATAMRLHALGFKSVYHGEVLARGLAPEDLRTALQQRLRWAQGTMQVMFRENPLFVRGLTPGQRLMYTATLWSYLSGFASVIYLAAPMLYLLFGILPVTAFSLEFFEHLLPYMIVNQLLFVVAGWGLSTWRGQQYVLALFPIWIQAVTSAADSVFRGRKLAFIVTPKTRQGGRHWELVRPQLIVMALLMVACGWGLVRLLLGLTAEVASIVINLVWSGYDLIALNVVIQAVRYQPDAGSAPPAPPNETSAEAHGRM